MAQLSSAVEGIELLRVSGVHLRKQNGSFLPRGMHPQNTLAEFYRMSTSGQYFFSVLYCLGTGKHDGETWSPCVPIFRTDALTSNALRYDQKLTSTKKLASETCATIRVELYGAIVSRSTVAPPAIL